MCACNTESRRFKFLQEKIQHAPFHLFRTRRNNKCVEDALSWKEKQQRHTEKHQRGVPPAVSRLSPGELAAVLEAHRAERSELRSHAKSVWRTTSGRGLPAPGNTPVNTFGSFSFFSLPSCPTVPGIRGGVRCGLVSLGPSGLCTLLVVGGVALLLLLLLLLMMVEFAMPSLDRRPRRRSSWLQSPRASSPSQRTPGSAARGPEAWPLDGSPLSCLRDAAGRRTKSAVQLGQTKVFFREPKRVLVVFGHCCWEATSSREHCLQLPSLVFVRGSPLFAASSPLSLLEVGKSGVRCGPGGTVSKPTPKKTRFPIQVQPPLRSHSRASHARFSSCHVLAHAHFALTRDKLPAPRNSSQDCAALRKTQSTDS